MQTLNSNELCVIIPVYNEQKELEKIIDEVLKIGALPIVINDGSTDQTRNICQSKKDIILINHDINKGYIQALNTGFNCKNIRDYKYIATIDGDGELPIKYLLNFISVAKKEKSDLVVGYRNYKNRKLEIFTSFILGYLLNIKDPFCGLKMYKYASIHKFLPFDKKNLVGAELLIKSKNII